MAFSTALNYVYEKGIITHLEYEDFTTISEIESIIKLYCGYRTLKDYIFATDPDTYYRYYH